MTLLPADPLDSLDRTALADPGRPLLETSHGRRVSYDDMAQLSRRLALVLAGKGVLPGERVVAQVEKSAEAVALYLACLRLGAAFVPLNTAYTAAELEYFLGDAEPKIAIGPAEGASALRAAAARVGIEQVETLGVVCDGSLLQLVSELPAAASLDGFSHADPSLLAALLYTSGTTGRPKGAMLSRGNLASNAAALVQAWHFTASDVLLHALPIFHVHGLFVALNTVLASGSSMLFMPRFAAAEVLAALPRTTVMMGVPTYYTRLLQEPALTPAAIRNIRLFISGSAPLLAETHRAFAARTGHVILERYGMSETLMNTTNPYHGERVPGSVGLPLPGVELRIAAPEAGAPPPASGATGMIEVRGPNVFSGYWRQPEKTRADFRTDGFFVTGDLGRIDQRGYVYIVGRGKDLIISGGYNVYPIEIETELDALPGVVESAVIGLPHADFGEGVTAIVVAEPAHGLTEPALRAALSRRLAGYKLPKRILFVADLPRNAMGKVQKAALREAYRELYRASC